MPNISDVWKRCNNRLNILLQAKEEMKTPGELAVINECIADELKIGVDNKPQRPPTVKVKWAANPPWYAREKQDVTHMIVCAYCDTRNEVSLSKCDSCGGSLSIENIEKGEE